MIFWELVVMRSNLLVCYQFELWLMKCCSGMPICEAFAQIEQQPNIYDVVHVKHFDEVWFKIVCWLCCLCTIENGLIITFQYAFFYFLDAVFCLIGFLFLWEVWGIYIYIYMYVCIWLTSRHLTLYAYYLQDPLKLDIVISFPDHGFHLRFDPWSQVFFPVYSNSLFLMVWIYCICSCYLKLRFIFSFVLCAF